VIAMLTDYHVHLRPDEVDAVAADHFTVYNVAAYRRAADERGIEELGVSEHMYRFRQASNVWHHPLWGLYATDDLDAYCAFIKEKTTLKLGIEADFIPGRERAIERLLEGRPFDYVIGSVHFMPTFLDEYDPEDPLTFGAIDHEQFLIWRRRRGVEEIWETYFRTLEAAARSGLFDIIAHPDLIKLFGPRPLPPHERFYGPFLEALRDTNTAVEISTAGLRKRVRELYPSGELLRAIAEAQLPVALSSDAHRPHEVGHEYDAVLELFDRLGIDQLSVFSERRRTQVPLPRPSTAPDYGGEGA